MLDMLLESLWVGMACAQRISKNKTYQKKQTHFLSVSSKQISLNPVRVAQNYGTVKINIKITQKQETCKREHMIMKM